MKNNYQLQGNVIDNYIEILYNVIETIGKIYTSLYISAEYLSN